MNARGLRYLSILMLLFALLTNVLSQNVRDRAEQDGALVVLVTWGDAYNTPATNVYVEAYGFVEKYRSKKSYILKMSKAGHYEASLPPGVYDIFVSDGTSMPSCKRVLIAPNHSATWDLNLQKDDVYMQR